MTESPLWDELRELDGQIVDQSPSAHVTLSVGLYVGLLIGTLSPPDAIALRAQLERELGAILDVPPELLEGQFRGLVDRLTRRS